MQVILEHIAGCIGPDTTKENDQNNKAASSENTVGFIMRNQMLEKARIGSKMVVMPVYGL